MLFLLVEYQTIDMKLRLFLSTFAAMLSAALFTAPADACTSVIVASKASTLGRPVMYKHRDTDELNNRIEYFKGPSYTFIGLVNSPSKGGEVWTGTNSAGFSIMNTASYNIKDDRVPDSRMDREGVLMYKALGTCADLADFERMLDTYKRPMGVEANFGVIDAKGGAAYYEVNNHSWVKYDVNDTPEGYMVVTNFSRSGREKDVQGYERYLTATDIMAEKYATAVDGKMDIDHLDFFWNFSRSYRHHILGVDYVKNLQSMKESGLTSGVVPDQDFIPRRITSASIVIEGVRPGTDPCKTVMWTILGYPACSVAVPLLVGDSDMLPSYVKRSGNNSHSVLCDSAMSIKKKYVFPYSRSNGNRYLDLNPVLVPSAEKDCLLNLAEAAELVIEREWTEICDAWFSGNGDFEEFKSAYLSVSEKWFDIYTTNFQPYLQ